ncbi:hypothetical protein CFTD6683_08495 [Campylobacter fetus subsp. testudinum]|uniref:methyltransferase domain-containing protein n=1 Tax=Campylobacter fetus TaxID=196 RepID=UPI0003C2591B|nr:methyltransferase domain-containing protein [Campylobacter fetus]AGZ82409.1 methyltransferase [Campylobacter fetus subsp. testudinum 03-427]AJB46132.1 hypothetical protein CR44_07950 [Campylobacter fetus subsp. testudinum]EAI4322756.1 class I SAM-dependent methyltransferase [Campylobacter fetus]EAI4392001.1 class I SAM-dependent methyltransferase [Campylobacter fetus]OCS06241.1 hypothetical protein CFTD6659_06460 [Campylobacter fetus subsp. testudinum]
MDKREILEICITEYMKKHSSRPAYCEYLRTKKYAYEMILKNFNGKNVLELGSDGAATSAILARWSENLDIVDMNDKISHLIEEDLYLKKAKFIKSLWQDFKPQNLYSDILLTDSLEHIKDGVELLSIIKNWLSSDGFLHIVVPNALSLHRLIGVKMGFLNSPYNFNENDISSGHEKVYDFDTLKSDILKSGLKLISMEGIQLKPLTDSQLTAFKPEFKDALSSLSTLLPRNSAEIYAVCGI